jgi:hypothetical protein
MKVTAARAKAREKVNHLELTMNLFFIAEKKLSLNSGRL